MTTPLQKNTSQDTSQAASTRVRTRFAPSPTGYLHIGGVRTALFSYLFAKGRGGEFVLRIEDTDTERSEAHYTADILESLKWLGLQWDEGPIYQSQRFEMYRQACLQMVASGHGYYCYCTPEQIDADRQALEAAGKKPMYSGRCRDLGHQQPEQGRGAAVIRIKVPREGSISYDDQIRGTITFPLVEIDDFVCLRANGSPTYNLACVVDDRDNRITHVIRGDDHINNTPKQVLVYRALGLETPLFAHLPMILGTDKKKLSKRHGAVSANQYRADGYLPHAVINYLARLGWGHGDQEIFSLDELLQFFSLEKIGKSNAVFDTEKLLWLNGHYLKESKDSDLAKILLEDFSAEMQLWGPVAHLNQKLSSARVLEILGFCKIKVKTLKELAALVSPFLSDALEIPLVQEPSAAWTLAKLNPAYESILKDIKALAQGTQGSLIDAGVDTKALEGIFRATAEKLGMKLVELAQPARYFVSAVTVGPSLFDVLVRMPWPVVEARLQRFQSVLK